MDFYFLIKTNGGRARSLIVIRKTFLQNWPRTRCQIKAFLTYTETNSSDPIQPTKTKNT